jgi:hypothetical protein
MAEATPGGRAVGYRQIVDLTVQRKLEIVRSRIVFRRGHARREFSLIHNIYGVDALHGA